MTLNDVLDLAGKTLLGSGILAVFMVFSIGVAVVNYLMWPHKDDEHDEDGGDLRRLP